MSLDGYHSVLVLGGIRSGKSEFAESLVGSASDVTYIATSAPPGDDPEWGARLEAHRDRRSPEWATEEVADDPGRLAVLLTEAKPEQTLLVDDLGGWLTSVLSGVNWRADAAEGPVSALVKAVRGGPARLVIVSPEVGLSLVPTTPSGRAFADATGAANRALADACDAVVLVVAGQPIRLKEGGGSQRRARIVPVAGSAGSIPPVPAPPIAEVVPPPTAEVISAPTASVVPAPEVASEPDGSQDVEIGSGMSLPLPDEAASAAATERLTGLDVPGSGLGALTAIVAFAAGVQGTSTPAQFRSVRVIMVHGTHGGALSSGETPAEWQRRTEQAARGAGPLGLLAGQAGASVQVVDVHAAGLPEAVPIEDGDAFDAGQVDTALRYGWRLANSAVDAGTDLLVLAAGGAGQEAAAAALVAATTGTEPTALLPRVIRPGGRIDDIAWMARCAVIRDGLHRVQGRTHDPKALLAALGGADFAVAAGLLLGAAFRRTPVLLDGPVGVSAALIARDIAAQVRLWLLLPDHGGHPTVRAGADNLSLPQITELRRGLGEGSAAVSALPLIQHALLLSTVDADPALAQAINEAGPIEADPESGANTGGA
jgi:nicotinate-nucleotide--dimethylbenzimidazole phosphoribosyltransferase